MDFKNNSGFWGSLQESPDNGKRGHIAKTDKRIQMLKKKIRARGGIEINKINNENGSDVAAAGGFRTPLEQLMRSQTEGRAVGVKELNYKNRIKDQNEIMIDTTTDFAEMQADGSWLRPQSCKGERPAESEIMKHEISDFKKQDDAQIAAMQRNHEGQKEEQINSTSKRQPEQEIPVLAPANTAPDAQDPVEQRSTPEQLVQPTT